MCSVPVSVFWLDAAYLPIFWVVLIMTEILQNTLNSIPHWSGLLREFGTANSTSSPVDGQKNVGLQFLGTYSNVSFFLFERPKFHMSDCKLVRFVDLKPNIELNTKPRRNLNLSSFSNAEKSTSSWIVQNFSRSLRNSAKRTAKKNNRLKPKISSPMILNFGKKKKKWEKGNKHM